MSNILGKAAKAASEWKLVKGTEFKLSKQQLKQTSAKVFQSQYSDSALVARVRVANEYVDFKVDIMCGLEVGDTIDPESIRVYDLTKDGVTITRLWGKAL